MAGNAEESAAGRNELAPGLRGFHVDGWLRRSLGRKTLLLSQANRESRGLGDKSRHAGFDPGTRLVSQLAADEGFHPLRGQFAAETIKRGKALEFSMTLRAAQEAGLPGGKFGRKLAGQGHPV